MASLKRSQILSQAYHQENVSNNDDGPIPFEDAGINRHDDGYNKDHEDLSNDSDLSSIDNFSLLNSNNKKATKPATCSDEKDYLMRQNSNIKKKTLSSMQDALDDDSYGEDYISDPFTFSTIKFNSIDNNVDEKTDKVIFQGKQMSERVCHIFIIVKDD